MLELLCQPHPLVAGVVERIAKQLAKAGDHRHRLVVAVGAHERRDGVHRIEQKVRLDLQLQGVQARVGQRRLELGGLQGRSR